MTYNVFGGTLSLAQSIHDWQLSPSRLWLVSYALTQLKPVTAFAIG